MRPPYVCMIAFAIAIILLSQPAAALPVISVPFYRSGDAFFLNASEVANLVILEVNTSHLAASDSEALAISFAPSGAGLPGGLTFAPTIAQTSSRTIACDQSYLFQDFTIP